MHTDTLRGDLTNLESKLESLEVILESQMEELQTREERWKNMDEKIKNLTVNESQIVRLIIGGEPFATTLGTLVSQKDTLFYKIILSGKFDLKKAIFFDRFSTNFGYILDYLRYKRINYRRFKKQQLEELLIEAEYYEIADMTETISNMLKEVKFLSFEINDLYKTGEVTAGTQNVQQLNDHEDRTCKNGIVAKSPGWILIELNDVWDLESLDVAGWNGNTSIFSPTNGANATILTSLDKKEWTTVGSLPSNFSQTIQSVKVTKTKAKFIKFKATEYIGIGYLEIHRKI